MKEIKYEKELFIPHKKFTIEELAELGVKPVSESTITSNRYVLCEYEHEHKNVSLDNYYSEDHMYHAVYDTQTGEFVMFNEETESGMGPWLSLTDDQEVGVPGLNVVCYYNYDYDSMEDVHDIWWNEAVLYGVFDDDGNIYRGALYSANGQLNIIETKNFIRFDDAAKDGSEWYKDSVDWIVVNGKLTCVKDFGEDAKVYSVIENVQSQKGSESEDKVLYVIWGPGNKHIEFYTIDSQTGKKSEAYTSYQELIVGEQLYKTSIDGKARIYPAEVFPEKTQSILRYPLLIREHSKYCVQKVTNRGYKTIETTLEIVDYNTAHDYYVFYDETKKAYFLRFLENNNQPELDIQLPPDTDLSKPISLEALVEKDPYNFEKLPTFEFGSSENIDRYLEAIVRHLDSVSPSVEDCEKDANLTHKHADYVSLIAEITEEKIAKEKAIIASQEQLCWEQKALSDEEE